VANAWVAANSSPMHVGEVRGRPCSQDRAARGISDGCHRNDRYQPRRSPNLAPPTEHTGHGLRLDRPPRRIGWKIAHESLQRQSQPRGCQRDGDEDAPPSEHLGGKGKGCCGGKRSDDAERVDPAYRADELPIAEPVSRDHQGAHEVAGGTYPEQYARSDETPRLDAERAAERSQRRNPGQPDDAAAHAVPIEQDPERQLHDQEGGEEAAVGQTEHAGIEPDIGAQHRRQRADGAAKEQAESRHRNQHCDQCRDRRQPRNSHRLGNRLEHSPMPAQGVGERIRPLLGEKQLRPR
jgi:hypothetical protein